MVRPFAEEGQARRLFSSCGKNLRFECGRHEEVCFGPKKVNLRLDGTNIAHALGAQENAKNARDSETSSRSQLTAFLFIQEHDVCFQFCGQCDSFRFSSMELQEQETKQAGVSRCSDLYPLITDRALNGRLRR